MRGKKDRIPMKQLLLAGQKKLKSQEGASLMVALLFFVMCAAVGSVILAAASSAAGRMSSLKDTSEAQKELYIYTGYLEKEFTADNIYDPETPIPENAAADYNPISDYSDSSEIKDVLKVMASRMYKTQFINIRTLGNSYWGTSTGNLNIFQNNTGAITAGSTPITQSYVISEIDGSDVLAHKASVTIIMNADYSAMVTVSLLDTNDQSKVISSISFKVTAETPEIRYDETIADGKTISFRVSWTEASITEAAA